MLQGEMVASKSDHHVGRIRIKRTLTKAHGSDVIMQTVYPDTDHVLTPGVNGVA